MAIVHPWFSQNADMELYIYSAGIVSGAGSNTTDDFLKDAPIYNTGKLLAAEPDYTGYIPPMQLRRMSKAVRMGIAASKVAMQHAGIEKPDAISIGTAMGCLQDTEVFLNKMTEQDEQMLTPTAFIQSTHNTVGGQIALLAGCYGHNLTYVHRGHSFEHALINAQLYLNQHPGEKILAGGIDELTDNSLSVMQQCGMYTKGDTTAEDILASKNNGALAGEGAGFFIAGSDPDPNALVVKDIALFHTHEEAEAIEKVTTFLNHNNLSAADIDLVAEGINGDSDTASFYNKLNSSVFANNSIAAFKHLSGEYGTASSFALGLLLQMVQNKNIPSFVMLNERPEKLKNFVLINHYLHYYSCWYIQAV